MRLALVLVLVACNRQTVDYVALVPPPSSSAPLALPAASDPPLPPARQTTRFITGDAVEVEWKGTWYAAHVLEVQADPETYRIHYDGYGDEWDEAVGADRIRAPSASE